MAGRYNTWLRNALADRIESNGGYWADRHSHFPIEYVVWFYETIDDADTAKALLIEHGHVVNETDFNLQFPVFAEWWNYDEGDEDSWPESLGILEGRKCPSSDELHSWAQEHLCDDLKNDDGFATWSPETAARYGFDYKGPGADSAFEVSLENHGRGGKHVVVAGFGGCDLEGQTSSELAEAIRGGDQNYWNGTLYSNVWCRRLMGMMDEWDVMLTDENANHCGLYYMTDSIARSMGLFD